FPGPDRRRYLPDAGPGVRLDRRSGGGDHHHHRGDRVYRAGQHAGGPGAPVRQAHRGLWRAVSPPLLCGYRHLHGAVPLPGGTRQPHCDLLSAGLHGGLPAGLGADPQSPAGQPHPTLQLCSTCWRNGLIMLTVDEAVARLLSRVEPRAGIERRGPAEAFNRVLAEALVAPVAVPPADNSAMDGYAYRRADAAAAGFVLPVSQRIPAGAAPAPLAPGSAARIFTGAEIPPGADTVAMQEACVVAGEGAHATVTLPAGVPPGDNIRRRGEDIALGETVLAMGTRLRPQEMGLLASLGIGEVSLYRPLRVAVFSTGDELVEPGGVLGPGQIFNSNRATLAGLLAAWGMTMVDLGMVRDRPELIADRLREAATGADLIVTSGGVSVGEEDHVKAVVSRLGSLDFWKIAIKPGKPLAFGEVLGVPFVGLPGNPASVFVTAGGVSVGEEDHVKAVVSRIGSVDFWKIAIKPGKPLAFGEVLGVPFVGLPGNPASVFVTALVLLRPLLFRLQGCTGASPVPVAEPALFSRRAGNRQEYLRARLAGEGIEIFPNQGSGVLSSACWGGGLAVQPPGQAVQPGDKLDFYHFRSLL